MRRQTLGMRGLDDLFEAVVDATEESVLNSLLMSPTTVGRDGNTSDGLDPDTVVRLLREHGPYSHSPESSQSQAP